MEVKMKARENRLLLTIGATSLAVASVISLLALCRPTEQQQRHQGSSVFTAFSLRVKVWILNLSGAQEKVAVLLPPDLQINTTRTGNGSPSCTLLIIFPGENAEPKDYVAIGKVIQEQAIQIPMKIVVGIGVDPMCSFPRLVQWAINSNDPGVLANIVLQKAEQAIIGTATQITKDIYDPFLTSPAFQNLFLWGHGIGGLRGAEAAYPSKYKGLLLYGCSISLARSPGAKVIHHPAIQKTLLASYPRPVLTMIGELDGLVRFYKVAQESQGLENDLSRKVKCTGNSEDVKRATGLRKRVIVFPELNHMQMATGVLPKKLLAKGRTDFISHVSLHHAHSIISGVALDFVQIHSTTSKSTTAAEHRLLRLCKTTHLEPWLRLTDPTYQCQFLADVQRQLLHITAVGKHPFHFYEDEEFTETSYEERTQVVDVIPQWHVQPHDFLYARPSWNPETNQICMPVVEQDSICISPVPQLSKTLAFKGRSQEEILFNQSKYQELREAAPTLMELNQQTFDKVLHHVATPSQRRRFLTMGKKLRFGPDIFVPVAPEWVQKPVSVSRCGDRGHSVYYLWQSTYTTRPLSAPAPFGGAWYGKPLSPAQAYEWIVFDAYMP